MNNEFEEIWKKETVNYFDPLTRHLLGGAEENNRNPKSGWRTSKPKINLGIRE
jgi:hypothetical protein